MRCNGTWSRGECLLLSLRDDGNEIRPDHEHNGRPGLRLTRSRANLRVGDCRIEPVAGGGTLVRCEVPPPAAGVTEP
jgi:nitrate/nitrite-specific signal transduction histidine kinase